MGKHPKFNDIEELFDAGKDFSLTSSQYEKKTGAPLPKDTWYLCNSSALSKVAKERGYSIYVIERTVKFKKQ